MSWIEIRDEKAHEKALTFAKGCYQRNLLMGFEALSGSTLMGKAKRYIGRYRLSAANLISRLNDNDIEAWERRGKHNKRILVIGPMTPKEIEAIERQEYVEMATRDAIVTKVFSV